MGAFCPMVTITFPDRNTEKRALAFLLCRFSGRVLRSGEHLVPEAALEALAGQNIEFTVRGKASGKRPMAAIDEENAASIALLQSWLEEDATGDPEELRKAQEELDEF